jgi:photosystem II stability/assembly factor-like uncharacterized protein
MAAILAFAAGVAGATAAGTALPAMAETSAATAAVTAAAAPGATVQVPRGLLPLATSWITAQRGIVLAYPSRTTGAKPYLLETGNGGKTWKSLTAPSLTYPADNDQPDAVWSCDVIAVTDGTHIEATTDSGKRWTAEKLAGLSGSFSVNQVALACGRVFALVSTSDSTMVYSGTATSGVLHPVRGLSIDGTGAYGGISTVGGLQVDLGEDYATEKYWYSRNGTSFTSAALPCPATEQAYLGGVRSGKVAALCSDGESSIGPGETAVQLRIAGRLGGAFNASGSAVDVPSVEGFAAASPRTVTVATTFDLEVSANAGKTWTAELPQNNGAFWSDLEFPSATTGFVVCSTVNNALHEVGAVYRTTDSGKSWSALSLP